ncbi:MAG: nitrogen fixation protein NifQ [Rhodocyclaceae bacterium]
MPQEVLFTRPGVGLIDEVALDAPIALALAGSIRRSWAQCGPNCLPLYGIDADVMIRIETALRPLENTAGEFSRDWQRMRPPSAFDEALEMDDLVALLHSHRAVDTPALTWLAHAVATSCLGDNHLWQDMRLPSRAVLSSLLSTYFPTLAVRNVTNMKWKKFFYLQLCERADIRICKSPSCGVCCDYALCFGSEEAVLVSA